MAVGRVATSVRATPGGGGMYGFSSGPNYGGGGTGSSSGS